MYIFIDWIDKTSSVINNSIAIKDELQERINSATLTVAWFNPSYFDDIKLYEWFPIISATSTTITLKKSYNIAIQNNLFRIWDTLTFAIWLSDEETWEITLIDNNSWNIRLTFWVSFTATPIADELAWIKKFAWNIIDIKDSNQTILENVSFKLKCLDYTRIFDKSLVNDTYDTKDARFIVNDFCNKTINNNITIDEFNYENTTALRTAWIESWDWDNPTLDTNNFKETTWSGNFPWTFSWWTANFTNAITTTNLSEFTWVSTWTPTKWVIWLWYEAADFSVITSIEFRIWSDSSNYWSFTITPTNNDWVFFDSKMKDMSITWTPDLTVTDYIEIIITQTADSDVTIDWIRILEEEFFKHYPYVLESSIFADFRLPRVKPTETMQRLADELAWYWYVDYDRNIRLFPESTNFAPIIIDEDSDNFTDLSVSEDTYRLMNRIVIKWWNETSEDTYSQVVEWDGFVKEWILKNKFKNLVVKLDDNSVTDTTEWWTTTTLINATSHGLVVWDYITNRTRSNAVRKVLTVPTSDSFTVEAVASQTSWDTFSTFVEQVVWVEWLEEEWSNDFMSNFNEKSIRNAEQVIALNTWDFLQFTYNEVFPILVQRTDNVSVTNTKTVLWYSDWIFDWQPITDRTLLSRSEAINLAEAKLTKYSNVVITATFKTNQEGLKTWQLIDIKDTTSSERNIDQSFLIQSVSSRQVAWWENIYIVRCSSLLFGFLELFQQLLATDRKLKVEEDEIINNIEDGFETVTITDVETITKWWEIQADSVTITDAESEDVFTPPFKWWIILDPGDLALEDDTDFLLEDWAIAEIDTPGGWPKFIWNLSSWN